MPATNKPGSAGRGSVPGGDGPTFKAWLEQMLAPKPEPGDIVTTDDLHAHRVQRMRQAIEAKDAVLCAPCHIVRLT